MRMAVNIRQNAKNKIIIIYLILLIFHIAHVCEETLGHFWIMQAVGGVIPFLLINALLFCVPVLLFYLVIRGMRMGYYLSMVYAIIMILNGLGHNAATIITGRYFGGYAGGFSGIGLIIFGILLSILLYKNVPIKTK
jgi:4-amino-4-deoxy-L-arabinose transferase-like glycosyltransferase